MSAVDTTWRLQAACRGMAPADGSVERHPWFPEDGNLTAEAAAICAGCPVRVECAEAGQGQHGVWGGRQQPKRKHRVAAAPMSAVEVAAARRNEAHRRFGLGDAVPVIASGLRIDRRSTYRLLGQICAAEACWCRDNSTTQSVPDGAPLDSPSWTNEEVG